MNGGSANFVQGGTTENGQSVSGSTVTVNGGTISTSAIGGVVRSCDGVANNNTLIITGGTVRYAYGGSANGVGEASGNRVVLAGGKVDSEV